MRISLLTTCVLAIGFGGTQYDLRADDPAAWPGFPALHNGDVNADGDLDLSDAVYLLGWLYSGGPAPAPLACATAYSTLPNGDANGDGDLDVSDPIGLLGFLFSGGPQPVSACAGGLDALAGQGEGGALGNPRVLPPHASAYGKTLGEWTAAWWQWALAMPISSHPLFDTADCGAGQGGKVWFLGGAFTGLAATRDCTVPLGKAILLPALNVECSTVEPPPFFGADEAELRACAAAFQDTGTGIFASVDGREVQNVASYRVQSPVFDFDAPAENVLFIPGPVSGQSVSDGVWVLLAPLSSGSHTVHFGGSFPGFPIDVTYNITVE